MLYKDKRILTAGLVFLFILCLSPAAAAAPQVPPKPDSFNYVFDNAAVLDPQDAAKISSLGRELDEKTKAQVVVVTVDSLGDSTIEEYANTLFRSWGLGDKSKNNGVLLLVNKENMLAGRPSRVRIEVGYGLEGAIPDGKAGRILDNYVLTRWSRQSYSEGILQGYLAIAAEVAKEYNISLDGSYAPVPEVPADNQNVPFPAPIIGFIAAVIILSVFTAVARKRRRRWSGNNDDNFGGWGGGGFFGGGFGGGGFGGGFGGGSSGGGGASR